MTGMSAHTPGPWSVHTEDLRGGRYFIVVRASVLPPLDIHEDENGEADAALISAAPDLLAALERMVALYRPYTDLGIKTLHGGPGVLANVKVARAAIAKAKGETT